MEYADFTETIEDLEARRQATQLLVKGAKIVAAGGIEGVVLAAITQPELILEAITSMARIIEKQEELIRVLQEIHMDTDDMLVRISQDIKKTE